MIDIMSLLYESLASPILVHRYTISIVLDARPERLRLIHGRTESTNILCIVRIFQIIGADSC